MRVFFIIISLLFSASSFGKEKCDKESLGLDYKSSDIETYFYTGTCHYRNEDYELSVKNWEKLALIKEVSSSDEELTIDVLNNLGYMKFFGFGTIKDQNTAMKYWQEAILLGHYEAEYHLCHAYADKKEPTFNLAKARKHCRKAELIYKGQEKSDKDILSDIQFYLKEIEE